MVKVADLASAVASTGLLEAADVNGGTGATGAQGQVGGAGAGAPGQLTLVALEVEIVGPGSPLTLDGDGQAGGKDARGQVDRRGGDGMGGRIHEAG